MTATALQEVLRDSRLRLKLAESPDMPEVLLAVLAQDPVPAVRDAVALNPAASINCDGILKHDADEQVRFSLARKMIGLTTAPAAATAMPPRAYDVLAVLVRDEAVRIRRLISEELAQLPQAPHDLILTLSRDTTQSVSDPVLRLSPLLTEADLMALLAEPPNAGAAGAIASRDHVPQAVCDEIARSASDDAIQLMLANPSAAIRESTLDRLIGAASCNTAWHEPLVRRPVLTENAMRALSVIVAADLLQALATRPGLDPAVVAELSTRLQTRLAAGETLLPFTLDRPRPGSSDDALVTQARQLESHGRLTEATLLAAAQRGEARWTAALLSIAAAVPLSIVDRATSLRSAKAIVSLVWQAGFTMKVAPGVQSLLGQLEPAAIMMPGPDAGFPLTTDEMRWQLDFLGVKRLNAA